MKMRGPIFSLVPKGPWVRPGVSHGFAYPLYPAIFLTFPCFFFIFCFIFLFFLKFFLTGPQGPPMGSHGPQVRKNQEKKKKMKQQISKKQEKVRSIQEIIGFRDHGGRLLRPMGAFWRQRRSHHKPPPGPPKSPPKPFLDFLLAILYYGLGDRTTCFVVENRIPDVCYFCICQVFMLRVS